MADKWEEELSCAIQCDCIDNSRSVYFAFSFHQIKYSELGQNNSTLS
jgi:hypothetical protein